MLVFQTFRFNFAEAAVLITGSTNVYSKKVEYVYQIAATFFENLKDHKEIRKKKSNYFKFIKFINFYR